ncbi:cysteine desulfurase [bacterium SM23_31]|nr:MAG: cysteine desulfurase [bacterium SM23_31]
MNVDIIRNDFPILNRKIHGNRIVYLDSAATTQKPACVINALSFFYRTSNANIHRGAYTLSEESSSAYENLREKIARFIGGVDQRGIVFTRNTTESLNLVARSWSKANIKAGDEIILTEMEHHSNLVPWIMIAQETGAVLKHIPVTEDGYLDMDIFYKLLSERTKVVSVTMVSNVLGTINPVSEIIKAAHSYNAVTVLDGAQGVPHTKVDAKELDCDFLAFSAHKMLGPTGIGVLYGKPELLEKMEPVLTGGGMIQEVTLNSATWAEIPWKFEAGTPNYADVIAFSSAIDYLEKLSMDAIRIHEKELTAYTLERLETFPDLTVYGPRDIEHRAGVVAFYDKLIHPHDLSTILDSYGIAIRAGHHCAQPLMRRYNIPANVRASFYIYNDKADVDALIEGLKKAREYFQYETS